MATVRSRLRPLCSTLLLVLLVWTAVSASPPLAAQQAAGDVAVVVHRDVPIDNLTVPELRRVLLGEREFWPASVRITLLIRAPIAHERDVVLKNLCQMTEAQFRQHWIGKVFRADTALAPKIVYSNEMAVDLVNRIPGAIAFIDASQVSKNLKVVKIEGHLPGDKAYVLR
jgi:ABC-type phosphate transport system substrate-binding protein